MEIIARLVSLRVGQPRRVQGPALWVTASFKEAVDGPVRLGRTNLEGDRQADTRVHGGPDKAVCVYSADHYPAWRRLLDLPDMDTGAFGENFSVTGVTEPEVCIGDRYAIGEAEVEVSQPRSPCQKLARRWNRADLPRRVTETGWSGWYLRVVREGLVRAGEDLVLRDRPYPRWTIARANVLAHGDAPGQRAADIAALAACPALSLSWRRSLARKVS